MNVTDNSWASLEVSYDRTLCVATPKYGPDDCHVTVKGQDGTRLGLEFMDNCIRTKQKEDTTKATVRAIADALGHHFDLFGPVTTHTGLRDCLWAHRKMAQEEGELTKGISQVLGGLNSPSLIRVPTRKDGTLDVEAMYGTVLDPRFKWLTYKGVRLPSPLYMEAYTALDLYTTKKESELSLGFYLDVEQYVVALDGLVKGAKNSTVTDVRDKALITFKKWWDKRVIHHHEGWVRNAVLHVRVDLPVDHIVVDQKTRAHIAKGLGISIEQVSGRRIDMTGFPIVNADCRPEVVVRVLEDENVQQHIAGHPACVKPMGRDNDGDVLALHKSKRQTVKTNPLLAMLAANKAKEQS